MDRCLKKYVTECLGTFERDDDAQLKLQEGHARAQGRPPSDTLLPLSYDPSGRKRGLYNMFALILAQREKPDDTIH